MNQTPSAPLQRLPSIDLLLRDASGAELVSRYGHAMATEALRIAMDEARTRLLKDADSIDDGLVVESILKAANSYVHALHTPSLKPVFNLSGTVLHTNLGRAPLPEEAIAAMVAVARGASNLEFDLAKGKRGDRDTHLENWLCRLTGAEAVTVVNNNAAAVLLVLNTLARRKECIVSRGELIEIGGSFRIPDVMSRAGTKLREVGTTNRTHAHDYETAIANQTALIMKVHTSNYVVEGFTASVAESKLAEISRAHEIPFVVDLGSGTLVDLSDYGLPHEPTVAETIANGADLVTFSGDKLLGGPQAGIIAGRADLIDRIKRNPMKRALRVDKMTIAALEAVLRLYGDPKSLVHTNKALRLLIRPIEEIENVARDLLGDVERRFESLASVSIEPCRSQIGSGAQPTELLPSFALIIRPHKQKGAGRWLTQAAAAFRDLEIPVIGRIEQGALVFDLRCLDEHAQFLAQLEQLQVPR